MAQEAKSTRSKAGRKAFLTRVRCAAAAGKKTVKVGKHRIPVSKFGFTARDSESKKAGKAIAHRKNVPLLPQPSETTKAHRAKKRAEAKKRGEQAKGMRVRAPKGTPAGQPSRSRTKRAAVVAGMSPEKKKEKKTMAGKLTEAEKKKRNAKRKRTIAKKKREKEEKAAARKRSSKKPAAKRTKPKKGGGKKGGGKRPKKKGRKGHKKGGVRAMSIPKGATKVIAADRKKHHRRGHGRRHYAMDNPLSTMEVVAGGLAMLLGLAVADVSDRWWATHSLVAVTSPATGAAAFTDTGAMAAPAAGSTSTTTTASTGPFGMTPGYVNSVATSPGLFNGAAVLAPMNLTRWINGGAVVALPFIAAAFVKAPTWRTGLQMFGFGALARIGGKALVDVLSQLLGGTQLGQQLYVNELAAAAQNQAVQGQTVTISLPNIGTTVPAAGAGAASGLAAPQHGFGCACASCAPQREQPPAPPAQQPQQLNAPPNDSLAAPPARQEFVPPVPTRANPEKKFNPFDVRGGRDAA